MQLDSARLRCSHHIPLMPANHTGSLRTADVEARRAGSALVIGDRRAGVRLRACPSRVNSAWQSEERNIRPPMYTQLVARASQRRQWSGRLKGLGVSGPDGAVSCMMAAYPTVRLVDRNARRIVSRITFLTWSTRRRQLQELQPRKADACVSLIVRSQVAPWSCAQRARHRTTNPLPSS
jgi:hypothetical protein